MLSELEPVFEFDDSVVVGALHLVGPFEQCDLAHEALRSRQVLVLRDLHRDNLPGLMVLAFDNLAESASTKLLQRLVSVCKVVARDDLVESLVCIEPIVVLPYGVSTEPA